jgi:Peroxidase
MYNSYQHERSGVAERSFPNGVPVGSRTFIPHWFMDRKWTSRLGVASCLVVAAFMGVFVLWDGPSSMLSMSIVSSQHNGPDHSHIHGDNSPPIGLQLLGYPPVSVQYEYDRLVRKVDWDQVEQDIENLLTDSQDWWPADYGNYGPLFIRLSWHSCGSYRSSDGRGGCDGGAQRYVYRVEIEKE